MLKGYWIVLVYFEEGIFVRSRKKEGPCSRETAGTRIPESFAMFHLVLMGLMIVSINHFIINAGFLRSE